MNLNKTAGFIILIAGLGFLTLSLFNQNIISDITALSLIAFGLSAMPNAFKQKKTFTKITIIIALLFILLAILIISNSIPGFEFYLTGALLIGFGTATFISNMNHAHNIASILTLIAGAGMIYLKISNITYPVEIPMIIGAVLIVNALAMLISNQ